MILEMNDYCSVELVELDRHFTESALEMNVGNRPINRQHVKNYAADMTNGNWVFNGEPIVFSSDGRMIQGQHRIIAHKESGYVTGVITLVVRLFNDTENKAFKTFDCGLKRSYCQVLKMEQMSNYKAISAIRRVICMAVRGLGTSPTVAMMEQAGRDYEHEISTLLCRGINFANFSKDSAKAGFVIAAKALKDVDFVAHFIHRVAVGANLQLNSPELAFKHFMENYKATGHVSQIINVSAACKCVAYAKGNQKMAFFRIGSDGIDLIKKIAKDNGVKL